MLNNSSNSSCVQKQGVRLEISSSFLVTTRQQRRKALKILIQLLQIILTAEKRYMADMSVNLLASSQYDDSEQAVSAMEEALDLLNDVYF